MKPKSNKYAWWKCKQGHSWKTKINNRVSNQTGCPYCAGTLVIPGETDLTTLYPEVTKEWDYIKNSDLQPTNISPKSNRYVWWKCQFGHEWKTKVSHRADGRSCPYCAGLKTVIGETDLTTINPSLAAEWNYEKNGSLTPNMITEFSHKKVWWNCQHGHEWQATISSRSNGVGCPICSGHKVIQGINDLGNIGSHLASEWHPTMNGKLTPAGVTLHSNKSVWWQCIEGHVWKTTINNRANGSGCPFCNQQRLIPSETSLAVVKPLLAKEWHPSKNGLVTAHDVPAFDNHKYWWQCSKGHEWEATVSNRSNGKGCPYCSGRLPILGGNRLSYE